MSYVDGVKTINGRYDGEIKRIEKVDGYYKDSLELLKMAKGINGAITLKQDLINKRKELKDKIKFINDLKNSLMKAAEKKDAEIAAAARAAAARKAAAAKPVQSTPSTQISNPINIVKPAFSATPSVTINRGMNRSM